MIADSKWTDLVLQILNGEDAIHNGAMGIYCKYGQNATAVIGHLSTLIHEQQLGSIRDAANAVNGEKGYYFRAC